MIERLALVTLLVGLSAAIITSDWMMVFVFLAWILQSFDEFGGV